MIVFFFEKKPQGSGKNRDLWRFFVFSGGRNPKIVGKTGISGEFFFGGGGVFFFWRYSTVS